MDYANLYPPLIELLECRYDKQFYTVVTTNLTPKEMNVRAWKWNTKDEKNRLFAINFNQFSAFFFHSFAHFKDFK